MADRNSQEKRRFWSRPGRRIDKDQPVNQKITLPSALKPAEPPKGSKWDKRQSSADEGGGKS